MSKLLGLVLEKCVFTYLTEQTEQTKELVKMADDFMRLLTKKNRTYLQHRKIHYGFAWKSKMALH